MLAQERRFTRAENADQIVADRTALRTL